MCIRDSYFLSNSLMVCLMTFRLQIFPLFSYTSNFPVRVLSFCKARSLNPVKTTLISPFFLQFSEESELKRTLQSLACGKIASRILKKKPPVGSREVNQSPSVHVYKLPYTPIAVAYGNLQCVGCLQEVVVLGIQLLRNRIRSANSVE